MECFTSRVNLMTGKSEWIVEKESYDYHQEIARSGYTDMLHDEERNKKYDAALKKAIDMMHGQSLKANVLDIGTGTGLLSMMAARSGADTIVAIEAFTPMAECAKKIIKQNGFENRIEIINKRSTEVTVGPGGDMKKRANILVTEVFDTELIGEGAIATFNHAHQFLLEDNCIVVPWCANMFAQVVHSELVSRWSRLKTCGNTPGYGEISVPAALNNYNGSASLHDLQLDQISTDDFSSICNPVKVFQFDFSGKGLLQKDERTVNDVIAKTSGTCHGVFVWWELQMDMFGEIMLSCAPHWALSCGGHMTSTQWRDHWMQAIFYPKTSLTLSQGDSFKLISKHDEYSLAFDVCQEINKCEKRMEEKPNILHLVCNRSRLGMMSDFTRNQVFVEVLSKVKKDSVCICLGDSSFLPIMAAKMGIKKIFAIETDRASADLMHEFIKCNHLTHQVTVIRKNPEDLTHQDVQDLKIDVILGEPYFFNSLLPWHNLHFWYAASSIKRNLSPDAQVCPAKMRIKAVAVRFKDLWKIRAAVGICEGFDISEFDKLIETSHDIADDQVEPQPLWEYPSIAMTTESSLLDIDLSAIRAEEKLSKEGNMVFQCDGLVNGVAIWADYLFDEDETLVVTSGPRETIAVEKHISWDMYTRQGVYLFRNQVPVKYDQNLNYKITFNVKNGDIEMHFGLKSLC